MGIPSSRRTRDRASRGSVDVFSAFERVSAFRRRRSASHSRARSKKKSDFGGPPGSWGPSARSLSSAPLVAAPRRSSTTFRGSARCRPKTPTNGTPPTFRTSRAIRRVATHMHEGRAQQRRRRRLCARERDAPAPESASALRRPAEVLVAAPHPAEAAVAAQPRLETRGWPRPPRSRVAAVLPSDTGRRRATTLERVATKDVPHLGP